MSHHHDHDDLSEGERAARYEQPAWDERYSGAESLWSGNPNPQLVAEVAGLSPGRALDIGCGEGADAVWLARQGWSVTGLDFSAAGLARAAKHAEESGVADRVVLRQADIRTWLAGDERWNLVSSQFMHQPEGGMLAIVRALADAVAPGGLLLVVGHHPLDLATGLRAGGPRDLFAADDLLPALAGPDGDASGWKITAEARPRVVTTPDGEEVTVHDSVLAARRPV